MSSNTEETTIQEDMAAAISELEAKGETTAVEAVEKLEPSKQERDDTGKFKSKADVKEEVDDVKEPVVEAKKEEVKEPVQAPLGGKQEEQILSQDKAPSSWTPKARESWAALPENVRQEVLRREEDSVKGIRQLQEQMAPYTQFANTLEPFIQEAIHNRTDPGQYIGNVMQAERRLRTGTAEERFSSLVEIAEGYGIPLRKIINDAVGQEIVPHPSLAPSNKQVIPPEVQRELDEGREFRKNFQTTQEAAITKEIEEFGKTHEFFEDLREDMGALMDMGRATTLQDAYDKASKINPEVSQLIEERSSKPPLKDKQKAAAQLKGTSSNSAEVSTTEFDDDDDTETTIRKAMAQASGRI